MGLRRNLKALRIIRFMVKIVSLLTWYSNMNKAVRTGRHCVFDLHVHLVFITKYRRNVFNKEIINDLTDVFSNVCHDFDAQLIECNGEDDHVHLLVNYPPTVSITKLVNSLKGVSSRMIRKQHYPTIQDKLWGNALWSPSYFAGSCGGAPIDIIRKYIEDQRLID